MHIFDMKGDWGHLPSLLYDKVVSRVFDDVYSRFVEELPVAVGSGALLDIGCGPGQTVIGLARRYPNRKVVGIDTSPTMVGAATERAHEAGTWNAHFELGNACALTFASDSLGLVLSIASIKHWALPVQGLEEMYRVAAPGASIVLLEVDKDAPPRVLRDFVMRWRLVPKLSLEWLPLFRRIGEAYFRRIVAGQSYRIDDIKGMIRSSTLKDTPWEVRRIPDLPFWMLQAQKPTASEMQMASQAPSL